jgi:alkanesulfonate monooxygenase SsuD/methylene tetrahydromethanopterin reductase-like flavin-dependent oxidoreductase (luciferase family)
MAARDAAVPASARIPIGVNLTAIGVTSAWWVDAARSLEAAGFQTVWCWDHFVSRGRLTDPCLECWMTLAVTAASTQRLRVGSFVTNVMNRHPAVLARMVASLADAAGGRVELGIGIGGHPAEHRAYGMDFPAVPERVERLEEAVQVIRLLWTGGPVSFEGRHYRLRDAYAFPAPEPPPRIVIGGEKPGGARLAARIGDAWTMNGRELERLEPVFREALEAAGRSRSEVGMVVALDLKRGVGAEEQPLFSDLAGELARWQERGADELVVHWVRPEEVAPLLAAAERAGLAG